MSNQKRHRKQSRPKGISVYRRGKSWAYLIELPANILTGERDREYKGGFETEDDAWDAAIEAKVAIDAKLRVKPSKRLLNEVIAEYLDSIDGTVKESTFEHYKDCWGYIKPLIGKRVYQDVDVQTHNALYKHLLAEGRAKPDTNTLMYEYWKTRQKAGVDAKPKEIAENVKGVTIHAAKNAVRRYRSGRLPKPKSRGLAPKTVKNIHRFLRLVHAAGVAWGYIGSSPAEHAALPREKRKSKSKRKRQGNTWTPEQMRTWLKVATDDRDAAMWVLVATTGARRSELAGAERDLLDLDAKEIDFADTRTVVRGKVVESDGKSEAGDRTLSLDDITVAYLRKHLEMLDQEAREHGTSYDQAGKLFCHPDGKPINPDTITRRFNRLVDRAGVPQIRLHDVRHSYATNGLDDGEDPKVMADRLGHANMYVTTTVYGHRSKGTDKGTAKRQSERIFGDAWNGPRPTDVPEAPE